MDEDTRKHGLRREGTYASAMGFMNRKRAFYQPGLSAGKQALWFCQR